MLLRLLGFKKVTADFSISSYTDYFSFLTELLLLRLFEKELITMLNLMQLRKTDISDPDYFG